MSDIPNLTESEIARWVGNHLFGGYHAYARGGAVQNPRLAGMILKGTFEGSLPLPYRAEVTLGAEGIVSSRCNCRGTHHGSCKHIAALLFTWLDSPERFRRVEAPDSVLSRLDRDGLIALIHQMLASAPDLESLLELPLPSSTQIVAAETIRRQVTSAMDSCERSKWRASSVVAIELEPLLKMGEDYVKDGVWRNAITVYEVIAREVLQEYQTFDDQEGEFHGVVNTCVSGLGQCLAALDASEAELRKRILRTLFDIYAWDVNYGGTDMGYESTDIILAQSTAEEKEQVVAWTSAAAAKSRDWAAKSFNRFMMDLQADKLDDESYLHFCRKGGRTRELVERLLLLGRMEEAKNEAQQTADYTLISLDNLFASHNHPTLVEQLVRERASESQNSTLLKWLKELAEERGNAIEVLQLTKSMLWLRPTLAGYQELKELAIKSGQWASLRLDIMAQLAKANQYDLIVEIHLEENEVDDALKTLPKANSGWNNALAMQVARAAEKSRPHAAIRLYLKQANRLIGDRGRQNYAIAATYLSRIDKLYIILNDRVTWQKVISKIRADNPRLNALKDELRKAGL